MKKALIHAWYLEKKDGDYYLPYCHWVYLEHISKLYTEIILLGPCGELKVENKTSLLNISPMKNIEVFELPGECKSYISSLRYFLSYVEAYIKIKDVDVYYARYPTPFGWLQKIFGKGKSRIIHYVGDPIDAAKKNPTFTFLKKNILTKGFVLENYLYTWACNGAKVFANGNHLSDKLKAKGISASPVISSTLAENDFFYQDKVLKAQSAQFIYLGYLRTAKGVETILKAFAIYNIKFPDSTFKIIGSGESECKLKSFVKKNKINNVFFMGQIDDRNILNDELRKADIFLFGSLSEGSPRVILEAMANGLAVISTPVGSLPQVFVDHEDILFADFNNHNDFYEKMISLTESQSVFNELRSASFVKVKSFTINNFIRTVFSD